MLAAAEFRRRWRSMVALTVLLGVVGALVLASAAGARRSDSALRRFNSFSRSSDLEISVGDPTARQLAAFSHAPGVAAASRLHGYSLGVGDFPDLAIAAPVDGTFGEVVDRGRLMKGRWPDAVAAEEVTIGEGLARRLHVTVGSDLETFSYTPAQIRVAYAQGD